jgi:hypothetical protein
LAPSQQQSNGHSELLKDFIGANIRSVWLVSTYGLTGWYF